MDLIADPDLDRAFVKIDYFPMLPFTQRFSESLRIIRPARLF